MLLPLCELPIFKFGIIFGISFLISSFRPVYLLPYSQTSFILLYCSSTLYERNNGSIARSGSRFSCGRVSLILVVQYLFEFSQSNNPLLFLRCRLKMPVALLDFIEKAAGTKSGGPARFAVYSALSHQIIVSCLWSLECVGILKRRLAATQSQRKSPYQRGSVLDCVAEMRIERQRSAAIFVKFPCAPHTKQTIQCFCATSVWKFIFRDMFHVILVLEYLACFHVHSDHLAETCRQFHGIVRELSWVNIMGRASDDRPIAMGWGHYWPQNILSLPGTIYSRC